MGDFNLDLFNQESHRQKDDFLNTTLSNAFIPLINWPTRVTAHTSTLIDNIFCNHYNQLTYSERGLILTVISDHYPLYHFDDISEPKNEPTDRVIRLIDIKTVNEFVQRIERENWDHIYNFEDSQEAYSRFSNLLRRHYCERFPKIIITRKYRNHLLWLTEELKTSIGHKNKLYKSCAKMPLLMNISNYKRYRNKANNLIKIADKLHHQEMFQDNKNNLTKTRSSVKNIRRKN